MFYNNEIYGIPFSGVLLDPNIDGSFDTGLYPDGYGEVYGIYWNSGINQSFGLAKHTIDNLVAPTESGNIFWPAPIPFGQKVQFGFNQITYYDTGRQIPLYDESGIINQENKAFLDIEISTFIPALSSVIYQKLGGPTGFFLTTGRYNNYGDFGGNFNQFINGLNLSNPNFTGYIAYRSGMGMQEFDGGGDFKNYLNSGILTIPIEKSEFFFKKIKPALVQDFLPVSNTIFVPCWRVTGFFSSFDERLSEPSKMFFVDAPGNQYCVFFSGYDAPSNSPLYLTYLNGIQGDSCAIFSKFTETNDVLRFSPFISEFTLQASCAFSASIVEKNDILQITPNLIEKNDILQITPNLIEKSAFLTFNANPIEKNSLLKFYLVKFFEFNH
jgi:hypothetical protein